MPGLGPTSPGTASVSTPTDIGGTGVTSVPAQTGDYIVVGFGSDVNPVKIPAFYLTITNLTTLQTEDGDNLTGANGELGQVSYGDGSGRSITSCQVTSGGTVINTANATVADVGHLVTGTGIPSGTVITNAAAGSTITISKAATATSGGANATLTTSCIGYEASIQSAGANIYFWVIKATGGSTTGVRINWGEVGSAGNKRIELRCIRPGAGGDVFPLRGSRIIGVGSTSGWASNVATSSASVSITTASGKCALYGWLNNDAANTPTITLDADNSGAGELSATFNTGGQRSFFQGYDSDDAVRPASTMVFRTTTNFGTGSTTDNAALVLLLRGETPAVPTVTTEFFPWIRRR